MRSWYRNLFMFVLQYKGQTDWRLVAPCGPHCLHRHPPRPAPHYRFLPAPPRASEHTGTRSPPAPVPLTGIRGGPIKHQHQETHIWSGLGNNVRAEEEKLQCGHAWRLAVLVSGAGTGYLVARQWDRAGLSGFIRRCGSDNSVSG